jgi:hypothetical protein
MKRRIIAALAAVGLVAAMSGFGTVSAMADEPSDDTAVVEETATSEETTTEEESTTEEETTTEESTEEESIPEEETTTEEGTTEEESTTEDETTEESTEEESSEEESTSEDETTTEEEATKEESTEELVTEDELPVVDGYTPEQVKEAQAFLAENGITEQGASARFFGITICHASWWGWGWDTESVGLLGYALHYLFDSNDIMPGIFGGFEKNLDTDFDGLTGQQIYDNDCSTKVKVYTPPEWNSDEFCWDGEAQDGSIWIYYSDQMEGKATWVVSSAEGFYLEVPFTAEWNQVFVPAGTYSVELVPIGGWHVKHGGPYWIEIAAAENCGCTVNMDIERVSALALDLIALPTPCAEAEVTVTPPTCEAAGTLVLGTKFLATFGEPVYENGHYTVTATADPGFRFDPGPGVPPDGLVKVFEGDLAPKLTNCGGLAVTGSSNDIGTPLWLAGIALIAGIGALAFSTRRTTKVTAD